METNQTANLERMRKQILDVISSSPSGGFRRVEVRRHLGHVDEAYFKRSFQSLVADGSLVKKRGGRYVTKESVSLIRGVIKVHSKGFGFVQVEDGSVSGDVFIPPSDTGGALSGDEVLIEIVDFDDPRGASGVVKSILRRGHEEFVACLRLGSEGYEVCPLRKELPGSLPLVDAHDQEALRGAKESDWVLARLVPGRRENSPMMAEIVRRISKSGSVTGDLNALAKEYDLPKPFTHAELRGVEDLEPLTIPREDMTSLMMVTIDPVDAKDFDDAISYQPGEIPGQCVVGVHIADVACYVTTGSKLDKLAQARGFTSYLPGRTMPMLPGGLTSDKCSLREGQVRLAHSVMMTIEESTGVVLSTRRVHSLVKVRQRLSFEEVERHLHGKPGVSLSEGVGELLNRLAGLAQTLRNRRREQDLFMPISLTEVRVLCGGKPVRVVGIRRVEPTIAHELVEEYMILANVEVARELLDRGIAGLFRVHNEPDERLLSEFAVQSSMILQRKKPPQFKTRKSLVGFLRQLPGQALHDLLCFSFLRCLPRASYSLECTGHFGLGKVEYCHFTSPIRRYPDLLIHQQLLAHDLGQHGRDEQALYAIETAVNALEQNLDQAGFAAGDRLKLRYLSNIHEESPSTLHEALVVRAMAAGLSLYLPEFGLMGFIERDQFRGGVWRYEAHQFALVNQRGGGQRYRCGDTIYVRVRSIDVVRGELNLRPM